MPKQVYSEKEIWFVLSNLDIIEIYLCLYYQNSSPNSIWMQNIICISIDKYVLHKSV